MSRQDRQRAHRGGVRAAQRRHRQLGTDLAQPIDIFGIVAHDCWLVFDELGSLYGQYQRHPTSVGVMVNGAHPVPLQRFTSAHEYGHHVLGHGSAVDSSDRIIPGRSSDDLNEVAAQAFAGEFLMPLDLVNRTLADLGMPTDQPLSGLSPLTAYSMSLRFGTTYTATITQLAAQKKIDTITRRSLADVPPRTVKAELPGGMPSDSAADVWMIDERTDGTAVTGRPGDEIRVVLAENPATGHVWHTRLPDGAPLTTLLDAHRPSTDDPPIGSGGHRHVRLRIDGPMNDTVTLVRRRPWMPGELAPTVSFAVTVASATMLQERTGLYGPQRRLLLADARSSG